MVKILLAEDQTAIAELTVAFLDGSGIDIVVASDGVDALAIFKTFNPDLVFLDINMPKKNGLETALEIRLLPTGKDVPIIGTTAAESSADKVDMMNSGMNDILLKPFMYDEFMEKIVMWLPQSEIASFTKYSKKVSAAPNTPSTLSIFEFDRALHEFMDDKKLLVKVSRGFINKCKNDCLVLSDAFQAGDFEQIRMISHSIKGGAGNLCAPALAQSARNVEIECKNSQTQLDKSLINDLCKEIAAFATAIEELLLIDNSSNID